MAGEKDEEVKKEAVKDIIQELHRGLSAEAAREQHTEYAYKVFVRPRAVLSSGWRWAAASSTSASSPSVIILGNYLGTMEAAQDATGNRELSGERRLLDEEE